MQGFVWSRAKQRVAKEVMVNTMERNSGNDFTTFGPMSEQSDMERLCIIKTGLLRVQIDFESDSAKSDALRAYRCICRQPFGNEVAVNPTASIMRDDRSYLY